MKKYTHFEEEIGYYGQPTFGNILSHMIVLLALIAIGLWILSFIK